MPQQPTDAVPTPHTLFARFDAVRGDDPGADAVLDADAGRTWSRDDLAREVERLDRLVAGALPDRTAGTGAGPVVAVQLPNGAELVAAVLACWRADLVPMPVDREVAAAELDRLCRATGAVAVLGAATGGEPRLEIRPAAGTAPALPAGTALLKVTSGTTGEPRAVAVAAAALDAGHAQIVSTMGIAPQDRNLVTVPLAHSYAFDNVLLTLALQGTAAVLSRDLTPRRLLRVARDAAVTVLPTVPFLLDVLARSAPLERPPLLRLVISAGAPLPSTVRERFANAFGSRPRTFYGATECGGIAYDRAGSALLPEGCVGTPLDGVALALDDADPDGVGRIRVRSRSAASGYHPPGTGKGEVELGGGEFLTADLGTLDDAGRLVLVGRVREVVNVGGRKVYPAEVERVIRTVPGVRDAVVLGIARSSVAEALAAVVAAEPHVTREAVLAACERRLARYKVPRTIDLVADLPRTVRGKLDRRALDARFAIG